MKNYTLQEVSDWLVETVNALQPITFRDLCLFKGDFKKNDVRRAMWREIGVRIEFGQRWELISK